MLLVAYLPVFCLILLKVLVPKLSAIWTDCLALSISVVACSEYLFWIALIGRRGGETMMRAGLRIPVAGTLLFLLFLVLKFAVQPKSIVFLCSLFLWAAVIFDTAVIQHMAIKAASRGLDLGPYRKATTTQGYLSILVITGLVYGFLELFHPPLVQLVSSTLLLVLPLILAARLAMVRTRDIRDFVSCIIRSTAICVVPLVAVCILMGAEVDAIVAVICGFIFTATICQGFIATVMWTIPFQPAENKP